MLLCFKSFPLRTPDLDVIRLAPIRVLYQLKNNVPEKNLDTELIEYDLLLKIKILHPVRWKQLKMFVDDSSDLA